MTERYDDGEVEEILRRALQRRAADGIDHEDLMAAAREAGIDPRAAEEAARAVREDREASERVALMQSRRKKSFFGKLRTFGIVNASLLGLDVMTGDGWWFYWPLMTWGSLVALDAARAFFPDSESDRKKVKAELARERAHRQRVEEARRKAEEAERSGKKVKGAAARFENAVEKGVAALLAAAATQVERATQEVTREVKRDLDSAFGSYVAKQEGRPGKPKEREPIQVKARVVTRAPEHEIDETVEERARRQKAR